MALKVLWPLAAVGVALAIRYFTFQQSPDGPDLFEGVNIVDLSVEQSIPSTWGAESFAEAPNGKLFTGLNDGRIVELEEVLGETQGKSWKARTLVNLNPERKTTHRPLGIAYYSYEAHPNDEDFPGESENCLIFCDGGRPGGLGVVYLRNNTYEYILSEVDGTQLVLSNSLVVTPNGVVIFTHSSSAYPVQEWTKELFEAKATGRLLSYDLRSKRSSVLATGVKFANGVVLSDGGKSIIFAESLKNRLMRASSQKEGELIEDATRKGTPLKTALFKHLPAIPDNLKTNPVNEKQLLVGLPALTLPPFTKLLVNSTPLHKFLKTLPGPLYKAISRIQKNHSGILVVDSTSGDTVMLLVDRSGVIFNATEGFVMQDGKRMLIGSFDPRQTAFVAKMSSLVP